MVIRATNAVVVIEPDEEGYGDIDPAAPTDALGSHQYVPHFTHDDNPVFSFDRFGNLPHPSMVPPIPETEILPGGFASWDQQNTAWHQVPQINNAETYHFPYNPLASNEAGPEPTNLLETNNGNDQLTG